MADLTSNQLCNICRVHYNAGLRCCALGSAVEGGYLYAKTGKMAWIIACNSREVSRTWALRNDAVTVAQASNACGDWFIPSKEDAALAQDCKAFWDTCSLPTTGYWSSSEIDSVCAWYHRVVSNFNLMASKTVTRCVRAIRRVAY